MEFWTSFYALLHFVRGNYTGGKKIRGWRCSDDPGRDFRNSDRPPASRPKVGEPYWGLINKWSDIRLWGRLVHMGVSYFRRQQSCAKVVYKLRSFAGTVHNALAGAWKTTLRIVTSCDSLPDECSHQDGSSPDQNHSGSLCLLGSCVDLAVPPQTEFKALCTIATQPPSKKSSYRENLKLLLPLTNRYAWWVAGIPPIFSHIQCAINIISYNKSIWLFSSNRALCSFTDVHV